MWPFDKLHPNSGAMVRAFEVMCPFFSIRPSVLLFLYFFQMKLTGKNGWVSLNSMSKKLFVFDSNNFCRFFKVLTIKVMANGLPLMFNWDGSTANYFTSILSPQGSSLSTRIC